jgi:esterase
MMENESYLTEGQDRCSCRCRRRRRHQRFERQQWIGMKPSTSGDNFNRDHDDHNYNNSIEKEEEEHVNSMMSICTRQGNNCLTMESEAICSDHHPNRRHHPSVEGARHSGLVRRRDSNLPLLLIIAATAVVTMMIATKTTTTILFPVVLLEAFVLPTRAKSTTTATTIQRTKQSSPSSSSTSYHHCDSYFGIRSSSSSSSYSSSLLVASSTLSTTITTTSAGSDSDSNNNNGNGSNGSGNTVTLEWTELFTPTQTPSTTSTTPVVFLHGLLGSKRNFASLATMLGVQLTTPRVIYGVDLRNHGDNPPNNHVLDEGCMTYPNMAADVIEFLNTQNIEKCIVVGHSMGGKIAQAMSLLYPHRVEGLVVIDIAPVTYTRTNNPNWKAVEDILLALKETCHTDTVDGNGNDNNSPMTKQHVDKVLRTTIPDPALRAFVLTNYDSHGCKWKIPIATLVDELHNIAGFDLQLTSGGMVNTASASGSASASKDVHQQRPHQQQIQYDGDVFIIHGGQSKFVRHSYMDTIAQYFPNHLLTTIRGAGHWVHAEAPDDTVALLKRFLDR